MFVILGALYVGLDPIFACRAYDHFFTNTTVTDSCIATKKTDVAEHPEVFHHVGLLVNGPPSQAGLPFN